MSASEARRRLEKFRARIKAEQQARVAAKDSVAKGVGAEVERDGRAAEAPEAPGVENKPTP
jgi:hypothetical protein